MNKKWKEHIAIPVSDKSILTPYVFYDYLLPELRSCLMNKRDALISLDMTNIEKISPLVLPNFLIVGNVLRNYFQTPVNLILGSRYPEMIRFLYCMDFFNILDNYQFFTYEKDFVGGFSHRGTGDIGILLYLPKSKLSAEEIANHLLYTKRGGAEAYFGHFEDGDLAKTLALVIGELVHNSHQHGRSFSIISMYGGKYMGLQCAVSDSGIGYYTSLLEKPHELVVYTEQQLKENTNNQYYKAIIEAVCKRFKSRTYGLSSVIRDIAQNGGTTRVHSYNTQVVFTTHNQSHFMNSDHSEKELADYLLSQANEAESMQTSPVRIRESKLTGVHVEFEIPPYKDSKGDKTI